jgi:SAM-dependent methyltransferase
MQNLDRQVVQGFGEEWARFPQSSLAQDELRAMFDDFFAVFPWDRISTASVGADFGCGSGRWAGFVAPRVGTLHVIDASEAALDVARTNLRAATNVQFHLATVDDAPLADGSLDFGYSLGVLHHIPDTGAALRAATRRLRPGAPFLVYLYYAFDNRPLWFRALWRLSDIGRRIIAALPASVRHPVCDLIAATVYWPIARVGRLLDAVGRMPAAWPLAWYRDREFYVKRTDALDRFGTRLEKRFTQAEITALMTAAGLRDIRFSDRAPFWCAVGTRG